MAGTGGLAGGTVEALRAAYRSAADRLAMSEAEFLSAVADWEVVPVVVDSRTAGALLINGEEIHACVESWAHKRWVTRRMLSVFRKHLHKHGRAVTSASPDSVEGIAFIERLGFRLVGNRGNSLMYEKIYGH